MDDARRIEQRGDAEGHDVVGGEFVPGDRLSERTPPTAGPVAEPARRSALTRWRRPLLLAAPVVLVLAALAFYVHGGRYEDTDNAYLQSGLVSVSPNVAGRVVAVEVRDNQRVRKGDVLFRIDPAPYRAAVDEAAAQLAAARTGWLAGRFGRTRLMLWSIVGFTIASGLCGIATSLGGLVGFRLLQGVFGAALVPMSQAILLDVNRPEDHGSAMSIWGMGAILGPIIGPALGGWLTDNYDWRWVFFINLPIGALAFAGLYFFLSETRPVRVKLDLFGFAMLALAIAFFQVMLDRGQQLDWFSSLEIVVEAALAVFFAYLFIVHVLTARQPFIDLALFRDRNFVAGSVIGFFLGVILFGVLALLPPMLEGLLGYPVVLTGLVTAPRGLGTMISMITVGRLIKRVDPRLLIGAGLAVAAFSTVRMSGFSLGMDEQLVVSTGFIQGLGTGLVFVPLSTIAFSTLDARLRNEGAAMFTLTRNIGSAVGISVLQFMTIRNADTVHARLVEGVRPDNPALVAAMPDVDFGSLGTLARLNAEITRQAGMVSYIDAFHALFVVTLVVAPLVLLMRPPRAGAAEAPTMHMD